MKKYNYLNNIDSPSDVKKLSIAELEKLSNEISDYIHEIVTELGGHYSSPLGVVDLTLALNYVYSIPHDKIIWDVGHQAYAHKIITGRREEFKRLRQKDGISGFLKIEESEYDIFGAGHSSTSISAALGFAHSRDKLGDSNNVLAVIGDGAMTGGLAYEGMNNLGYHRSQLTIVLNDNSLSISKSVGALSKYLTRITTNPTYNKLRNEIWSISGKIPKISKYVRHFLRKTEGSMKSYLTPGNLFEELGLRYIGPIDGHDIKEMVDVFNSVKKMKTPVLVHVFTDKTKRIKQNKSDAIKYYSLSGIKSAKNEKLFSYSEVFGKSLLYLSNTFDFKCVTAAMEIGTGLTEFISNNKDSYIDVGIAEGHAVTYSAGLSAAGIIPIIPIYSTFMQRAYDHIIHDFALQSLPGIFCMDRSGLVGNDGPTHHGVFDINFMSSIPGMVVFAPKDGQEFFDILYTALLKRMFISIRYPKMQTKVDFTIPPSEITIGSWETVSKGRNVCLLAVGSMLDTAIKVKDLLKLELDIDITVINCRFIKPIDKKLLNELILIHNYFITIEEGILRGGFGSFVSQFFNKMNIDKKIFNLGIDDEFTEHGSRKELLKDLKLDSISIVHKIKEIIK